LGNGAKRPNKAFAPSGAERQGGCVSMKEDRELAELEAKLIRASIAYRNELLHGALTVVQVAALLHVSPADVMQRMADHAILGIVDEGEWRFPTAQFEQGRVLPGLDQVLKILTDSNVTAIQQLSWLVEPHPAFGASPIETLRAGEIARVVSGAWAVNVS
jgi:hypothetical protein